MKVVIVGCFNETIRRIVAYTMDYLNREEAVEIVEIWGTEKKPVLLQDLKNNNPDVVLLFDLYGLEQCTLTDGIAYNLLDCKFVHLLIHNNLKNEILLKKQLSISMFFYCVEKAYYEHLQQKYPEIPYLKCLDGWKGGDEESAVQWNADIIISALEEVLRESHLL